MDLPKVCHILRAWITPYFFTARRDEKLYLEYTEKQKQRAIPRILCFGLIFQTFTILVPGESDFIFAYSLSLTASALNLILLRLYFRLKNNRTVICHITWLVLWAQILISAVRRQGDAYNELLGWACFMQYLTFATLPLSGPILLMYSTISALAYVWVQLKNASMFETREPEDLLLQGLGNISLLLCAGLLGITAFVIYEGQHRRSFIDTKRSLRDKLTIEQQSKEQERLLLSVLPEHVAVQMRKDLGLIDTQFKKIYMSRHENVSILYADIVGFTAISSTYSAQDLVAILNELFARFDRLSEKYQQLRIKILGDCYYCISGAPVERPDHAVLCVHMGLSMVKAIKYVQQTTKSPVDMRVGIHTGAILAGVLGQRQWQFDVYSRDVELANKMESSGMAGRVHVSEVTLGFLNNEFEVEPAYGEKREEMLRQAGIKTFFIAKVLKPASVLKGRFQLKPMLLYAANAVASLLCWFGILPTLLQFYGDEKSGEGPDEERGDTFSDLRDDDEDSVLSDQGETKDSEEILIHNMLEEELRNRDDDKELKATGCCLSFSLQGEVQYLKRSDPSPLVVVAPPFIMVIPIIMVLFLVMPDGYEFHNIIIVHIVVTTFITFIFYVSYRWKIMKKQYNPRYRAIFATANLWCFLITTICSLLFCDHLEMVLRDGLNEDAIQHSGARICQHPSYFYHMSSLTMCGLMLVSPFSHVRRLLLLILICFLYIGPTLVNPLIKWTRPSDEHVPYTHLKNGTLAYEVDSIFNLRAVHYNRHILMVYLFAICVAIFDRYLEALSRARHLRTERMRVQAEQAADLRRRNQALVYNVLPPHVARHFMGAHRNHRDLYSQSYAEVGVLFASMPNFTEFYSEETVNNQGLECLRFLNEVISDFDLLLEESKFRDIIKIKTISSTYMAASGLNPKKELKDADTTVLRWNHLMCLVEFALELQRVLAAINEQSFNHFVLRLGVNHGPITAGVIGAKKPHYDIWGNTVNVASRMESTGKAGCIQVTEETCRILEEFGYYFEQRGLVAVKGKGQLMTYYLQGRNLKTTEPTQNTDSPFVVESGDVKIFINGSQDTGHEDPEPVADIPLLPKGF